MNYDEQPIITFTEYSFPQMQKYYRHVMKPTPVIFLMILVYFYLMGERIGYIISNGNMLLTIGYILLIILLPVLIFARPYFSSIPKKWFAVQSADKPNGQTITFTIEGFTTESHGESETVSKSFGYADIRRISDGGEMFYIIVESAFILIDKNGFKSGNPDLLAGLLTEKVTDKKKFKMWKH